MPHPIRHSQQHHATSNSQSQPRTMFDSLVPNAITVLILTTLFLFLAFAFFVFFQLCLLAALLLFLHQFRRSIQLRTSSDGLAPLEVKKLPHFRVAKGTHPGPETQCVVCLEGFRNNQWFRKLAGCGHVFHQRCVDEWLVKVAACPTCRTPVRLNAWARGSVVDVARQLWTWIADNINAEV